MFHTNIAALFVIPHDADVEHTKQAMVPLLRDYADLLESETPADSRGRLIHRESLSQIYWVNLADRYGEQVRREFRHTIIPSIPEKDEDLLRISQHGRIPGKYQIGGHGAESPRFWHSWIQDNSNMHLELVGRVQELEEDVARARTRAHECVRQRDEAREAYDNLVYRLSDAEAGIEAAQRQIEGLEDDLRGAPGGRKLTLRERFRALFTGRV